MALSDEEVTNIISKWPSNSEDLPPSVRTAYEAWTALTVAELQGPIRELHDDPGVDFTTPRRGFPKHARCVTLTAYGKAPTGTPVPVPDELRSLLRRDVLLERRLKAMEAQLVEAK